jgi:tRNA pseudouridine55 synthase
LAQFYTGNDKTYEGTIRFGYATTTYDAAGAPTTPQSDPVITPEDVERALAPYRGTFSQTPPSVSAKKIQGRPAYELFRKNIAVELKPVEVTVRALEVLSIEGCSVRVRVTCSAGTYVRSIAHDAGQQLGCGAFLSDLRRTASGAFRIDQARTLEDLAELAASGRLQEALIPASELLPDMPTEIVDQVTESQIRQGRDFRVSPFRTRGVARLVKAVNPNGELVAIGEARLPNIYHPMLVL